MKIRLADIPEGGLNVTVHEPVDLGVRDCTVADAAGCLTGELFVQEVSGELIVRGTVGAEVEFKCARCLEIFSTRAEDSSFLRVYSVAETEAEMDVSGDLREAVLLNLPVHPLCRETCAGLCPQCGKNLNEGPCGCTESFAGGLRGALEGLKWQE